MDQTAARLLDGRYRIEDLLGEGAMSTVSRARDELLGRTVAVKLLRAAYGHDTEFVARFYAEARMAARIVDARVVAIYDIVSDGNAHAIVMEYVAGTSLAEVLRAEGPFAESRSIDYARQIALALGAAHAQHIVHRDLKPANVLLGGQGLLKVTDFGLAKAIGVSDLTLGAPGALIGSVHYFSPEQARGQALGAPSDLYSLGIMLYQFCTGSVPYTGDSPVAIALAHVDQPTPTVATLRASMSEGLANIVHRLLQKEPQARFASAAELDAALARLESGIKATVVSAAYGVDAPTLVVGRTAAVPPPPARPGAEKSPRPRRRLGPIVAVVLALAASLVRRGAPIAGRAAARGFSSLRRLPRAVAVAAVLAAIVAAIVYVTASSRPPAVAVADVRQKPLAKARATLAASGLVADVVARPDRHVPAGYVIAEKPKPGSASHRGDRIALFVSSGPPLVEIPNLLGVSFHSAVQRLQPVRLHVRYAAAFSAAPASTVIEQIPSAGTRVREGTNAIVVISTGARPQVRVSSDGGSD
ncbi:MAG: hypothetical protein NVSMB19_13980 [Vulcanimicrobiaceae bacterium]